MSKSKWEKLVKVSLDSIFDDDDGVDMSNSKIENDPYSKMSSEEINEVYDILNDESYLEDLNDYYSDSEQIDLASEGIHLTVAKKYHLETGKKPIWKSRVTNKFRDWLKTNFPDLVKLMSEDKKTEKEKLPTVTIQEIKTDSDTSEIIEEKLTIYEHALAWLYNYMEKLSFGDFVPTDKDIKKIEKIDEMVNNE